MKRIPLSEVSESKLNSTDHLDDTQAGPSVEKMESKPNQASIKRVLKRKKKKKAKKDQPSDPEKNPVSDKLAPPAHVEDHFPPKPKEPKRFRDIEKMRIEN